MTLRYHFVEILDNNYVWVLEDSDKNVAIVDPGSFKEIDEFVKSNNFKVKQVLITHTHYDHIGGLDEVVSAYKPEVFVPYDSLYEDNNEFKKVKNGDKINVLGYVTDVYESAYHKNPHVFYHLRELNYIFMGDLIFPYGVGRRFGTDIEHLESMLKVVSSFDDDALVFSAHEYGKQNLEFLAESGFENDYIKEKINLIKEGEWKHTIPFTLASQKDNNAFFHYDDKAYLKKIGAKDSIDFLTQLRKMRDVFQS